MIALRRRLREGGPRALADAIWALGLIVLGGLFFAPLERVAAIEVWDESAYMWRGLRLAWHALPPEYAPLYALFYRLLAWVEPEPLRLYYMAYRAVALLVALSAYWALRRAGVWAWVAGLSAWWVLTARGNALVWPRVSSFAVAWILAGLGAVWGARGRPLGWRWAAAGVVLWTAAYIRPEMALAAGLTWLVAFVLVWRDRRAGRGPAWRADWLGLAAVALFPLLVWGSPLQPGRSWNAFAQHFTVRRAALGDDIPDPWRGTGIQPTIARYFGPDTHTIWDALRANPAAIWAHIQANAHAAAQDAGLLDLFDGVGAGLWAATRARLLFGVALGSVVWLWRWRRGRARSVLRRLGAGPWPWPGLAMTPALGAMLFIFPHSHYAWIAGLLGGVAGVLAVAPQEADVPSAHQRAGAWANLGLSVLLVLGLARYGQNHRVDVWLHAPAERVVPALAAFARDLPLAGTVPVLGAEGALDVYLGPNFIAVDEQWAHSQGSLLAFLRQQRVRMLIFRGPEPTATHFCRNHQEECAALVARPHEFGFRARWLSVAGGEFLILIADPK